METIPTSNQITRYGFYYYPDTVHYSETDLHAWIPELKALGASWLTLLTPMDRAIPESFIRRLINEGIQPILHLPLRTTASINLDDLSLLFHAYANWGVKHITLFDRPNLLINWSSSNWAKGNLVERFLDIFIPVALEVSRSGLIPVFPPLEPGGDYWDIAFLSAALQGVLRRGQTDLLSKLILSAYAWPGNRSLNWGAGGPERWPRTRPYSTPQNSEDHLGFRIFDWYLATSQAAIGKMLPIILLAAGSRIGDQLESRSPAVDTHAHTWQNMTIIQLMSGRTPEYDAVPPQVLCCNFWLLSAKQGDKEIDHAWYKPDRSQLPIVDQLKEWVAQNARAESSQGKSTLSMKSFMNNNQLISHYLLLPSQDWGSNAKNLELIRPFIKKFQPTIGFSPVEASHAKKVTVIARDTTIYDPIIDGLIAAGCIVEQISGDGINIAT